MNPRFKRAALIVLLATGLLLALYALAGFLLLPVLVERKAAGYIEQRLGVPASVGKVSFNPFVFTFDASDVRIGPPQAPLLAAEHLHFDFELSSIFRRAWTFAELRLDGLDVRAEIAPDGRLNLADLRPKSDVPAERGAMPNIVLRHAVVRGGQIVFTDRRRSAPASATLKPIDVEVFELTTLPDRDGRYTVAAMLPDGGKLDWRGTVSLRPLESAGELKASGLQVATLWPFVRDSFRLKTPGGTLSASTRYTFSSIDGKTALRLDDTALHLQGLALIPVGSDAALLKLEALDATKASVDLMAREFVVPQLALRGGALAAPVDPDGVPVWQRALSAAQAPPVPSRAAGAAPGTRGAAAAWHGRIESLRIERVAIARARAGEAPLSVDAIAVRQAAIDLGKRTIAIEEVALRGGQVHAIRNAAGSIELLRTATPNAAGAPTKEPPRREPAWRYGVAALSLDNLRVALRDRSFTPAIAYDATITRAVLKNFASPASAPWQLDARLALAGGATATATGSFVPGDKRGEGRIELAGLPLRPLQPLLARHAALDLKSGSLSGAANINLDAKGDAMRIDARGELRLTDVLVNETLSGDRFLSCKRLDATGVAYDGARKRLVIREVDVLEPGAKLVISKDRQVNLTQVLKRPPVPAQAKAAVQEKQEAKGATPSEPRDAARSDGVPLRIARINLREGVLDYADQSLVLPFATRITRVKGTIVGIAGNRDRPAQVQAAGEIEPFGAARVDGSLLPFAPTRFLDLKVRMDNVEMPPLSPYTATFAGRKVAAGKLWLELNYKIVDRQLLGDNNVRIAGFKLGERVEASRAKDLPLDLAVALLTDSQGRINIAVPVRGDLNAPRFDFGTVFREAVGSLLQRIVSAPFRALGALFGASGGSEKQATIAFEPGSDELLGPEREKLATVATALAQRPQLKLVVHGPYAAERDSKALRQERVRAELARAGGQDLAAGEKPGPIDFRSRRMQRALDELLAKYAGEAALSEFEPRLRDARSIRSDRRDAEAQVYEAIYNRIVERYPLPDGAAQQLATRRGEAIRDYMVRSTSTPADRIEAVRIRPVTGDADSIIGTPLELSVAGAAAS